MTPFGPPYTEVRFTLPFSLPFSDEFSFDWQGDSFWVKVENVQVFDLRSEEVTGFKFATSGSGSVSFRGPHGLSHLAKVTVRFRVPSPQKDIKAVMEATGDAKEKACEALNRVIEACREATSDFRVRRVMPEQDVISFHSETIDEEGQGFEGFMMGGGSLTYPVKVQGYEEAKERMNLLLREHVSIPFWRDYLHEARRFYEQREFRVAVILSNVALELMWAETLNAGLVAQGVSADELRTRMRRYTTPTSTKGTLTRLDQGLQEVFKRSMKDEQSDLWKELDEQARTLRKNVLHPMVKRPRAEESLRAMSAIERTIQWLGKEIVPLLGSRDSPAG